MKKQPLVYTCTTDMVSGAGAADRLMAFFVKLPANKLPVFSTDTATERAKELIRTNNELAFVAYRAIATRSIQFSQSLITADKAMLLLKQLFYAPLMDDTSNEELAKSLSGAYYLAEAWSHATYMGVNKVRVMATYIPAPKIMDCIIKHLECALARLEKEGYLYGYNEVLARYVVAVRGVDAFKRYKYERAMCSIFLDSGIVYEPWVRHWINHADMRTRILRTPAVWEHQDLAEELLKREVTDLIEQSTQNASCKYVVSITAIKKEV